MVNQGGVMASEISVEAALAAEREAIGAGETTELSALCISGGGIRSATFGLGCLQGPPCQ